eukprot:gene3627-6443_t
MEKDTNNKLEEIVENDVSDMLNFNRFSYQMRTNAILHNFNEEVNNLNAALLFGLQETFETSKQLPERPETPPPTDKSPKEIRRILKKWLEEHEDNPYPTESEKVELEYETGLKRSQIDNCKVRQWKKKISL